MSKFFIKFFCIIFTFNAYNIFSCTIFTVKTNDNFYFCNNEDWTLLDPIAAVEPKSPNSYGFIVFGWDSYYPAYPQGGVNEKGLCLDWAIQPKQNYKNDPKKKNLNEDLTVKILKNCATVDEAVNLINQYNYSQFGEEHLLIADRNNKSCIIEYNNGHMEFIFIKSNYQLITNFNTSNPQSGYFPCTRYNAVKKLLEQTKITSIDNIIKILDASQMKSPYQTVNSYIIDIKNLKIEVFYKHNFTKSRKIDILKELKKGRHIIKLY